MRNRSVTRVTLSRSQISFAITNIYFVYLENYALSRFLDGQVELQFPYLISIGFVAPECQSRRSAGRTKLHYMEQGVISVTKMLLQKGC